MLQDSQFRFVIGSLHIIKGFNEGKGSVCSLCCLRASILTSSSVNSLSGTLIVSGPKGPFSVSTGARA